METFVAICQSNYMSVGSDKKVGLELCNVFLKIFMYLVSHFYCSILLSLMDWKLKKKLVAHSGLV